MHLSLSKDMENIHEHTSDGKGRIAFPHIFSSYFTAFQKYLTGFRSMNLLSGIIWHLATGHGQLYELQRSDPSMPFTLVKRIVKTLLEHIRAGVQCHPAINTVLARKGLKGGQRTLEALSKEESSKKEIIAVLFNLLLSISCFLHSWHCITFPSHTDVTLQISLGSRPDVSRVCEKRPLVTKLMTCKMDKLEHPN